MQHKTMYFLYLTYEILVEVWAGDFNRIKALGLCQGWTRPLGRAVLTWSFARGSGPTLPQTSGFNP